ncbi:MAG: hypothetical protein AAGF73_03865 [Actinomycetota bacterium]
MTGRTATVGVGSLTAIHINPVKSCRAVALEHVWVIDAPSSLV